MVTTKLLLASGLLALGSSDFVGHNHNNRHNNNNQLARRGRQEEQISGGIDFSGCEEDPDTGLCCVEKEETVTSLEKEPILECTHKNVEQCHYTYVTQFSPSQEEVCEENFEKQCSITFKQQAYNETVKKCYKPIEKVCNGQGEEECRTVYESSCTTKYVGINCTQAHLPLQLSGSVGPVRGQVLAVTAPGSVELDKEPILRVEDLLAEIRLGQLNNILALPSTSIGIISSTGPTSTTTCLASHLSVHHLLGSSKTTINQTLGIPASIVILGFVFVESKDLDGWKALNTILSTQRSVLISVHCSNLHNSLQSFSCFSIVRNQSLAVPTPRGVELDNPDTVTLYDLFLKIFRV